ncbi:bifunctional 4-hydroxy-2-oxoglutarate aldolase/2-dehydro-3-deoxy-phosphogluconate aldolase [Lachnoclostridium phytofermentans]|uniref:2-dehydro-3-deoxy-phosphogluconate aldolase n=1 Tax=Lachnoclostridium phytofermentans (strain ATCC 700394 / DSM 18823 / ISDg) TaxID=357809 RepID=A9KQD5_LACP7|nr:bifunctional 4-hydroxy-2-oxoglutarate aldolase/2-dehydro-3-deoxy-phosphogluconate aldolase [Lachnoclostridium phytofermentans]ABX40444.1 2-dehydro-3-deoxyphosphogluconate aldolase/4-hydroxy-2-oxoglutarate aldolase [Lachnoclostridium phytofermentans ISDg]
MNEVLKRFEQLGIIPVVKIDDAKDAAPLAKALCEGGLPVAEVTFRTAAAEEAIRNMVEACPDMFVGAGTVLTTEQVDRAIAAGCKFIVSPGLNPKIVKYCIEKGIPITPGTSSPTDIEQAIELGLEAVKFFPAEASGGLAKIKAMAAPYVNMRFMPTGGISEKNLTSYLDFPKILACGGSWMVSEALINGGKFDEIKKLTREAVNTMLGFELKHVGINATSEEEADGVATSFEKLFGFTKNVGSSSIFAGSAIEVMKTPYLGAHGHIAIQTNYIERAIYHMELQGFEFDMDTAKYNGGKMVAVYLKGELGGFAVHLLQKK